MLIGHYGAAFVASRARRTVPLAAGFVGAQLVDIAWSVFVATGVEHMRIVPGITATNAFDLYDVPYTHSLLGSAVWAIAGGLAGGVWLKDARAGVALGLVVFSHWVLDLVVHRPDLLLWGDTKVGLGLWNFPAVELALELALFCGSAAWYAQGQSPARIKRVGILMGVALVAHAVNTWGPVLPNALVLAVMALLSYGAFAALAAWVERVD